MRKIKLVQPDAEKAAIKAMDKSNLSMADMQKICKYVIEKLL